jgi:uncharacterized integral membrane protein
MNEKPEVPPVHIGQCTAVHARTIHSFTQGVSNTLLATSRNHYRELDRNPNVPKSLYIIYLLTAIGLSPGGSSTVHIYTQTIHRTTQITTEQHK